MININVAIVEDEQNNSNQLSSFLRKYFDGGRFSISIYPYQKSEAFISSLKNIIYDVVFMDIDLPDLDGISTAKLLRKNNAQAIIVFVTNLAHLAIRGYEVNAIDFVIKPVIYEDFKIKLKRIESILTKRKAKTIPLQVPGGMRFVRADEIMYIEVINHTIIFHLINENVCQWGSLSNIEKQITGFNFIKCNRCYLVNPMHIKKMEGLLLTVGEDQITVSRPKKSQFMEELNNYLNGGK